MVYLQDKIKPSGNQHCKLLIPDGRKLYDIDPIKMVEGAIKSAPATTASDASQSGENINGKFPLKAPVEENPDLLALHNAKESDIFSALNGDSETAYSIGNIRERKSSLPVMALLLGRAAL